MTESLDRAFEEIVSRLNLDEEHEHWMLRHAGALMFFLMVVVPVAFWSGVVALVMWLT